MSDDIEKEKTKVELENLGRLERLIDRYAQSRSLGLLIPLVVTTVNALLLIGVIELVFWKPAERWVLVVLCVVVVWVPVSVWVLFKLVAKYEFSFYRKDGKIELQKEKVPIWAWIAYMVTFVGPAVLSKEEIMPVRWALTVSLVSFAVFMLYLGKKHKEKPLGVVFGGLCLTEALVIVSGLIKPFGGEQWIHSYFVTLMAYIIGAGLITAVVVHIYNRKILRKIKEMRLFGEREANTSDS